MTADLDYPRLALLSDAAGPGIVLSLTKRSSRLIVVRIPYALPVCVHYMAAHDAMARRLPTAEACSYCARRGSFFYAVGRSLRKRSPERPTMALMLPGRYTGPRWTLMATQLATRRFSVREYQRMIEAGVLAEDEHVEPLEVIPTSTSLPARGRPEIRLPYA